MANATITVEMRAVLDELIRQLWTVAAKNGMILHAMTFTAGGEPPELQTVTVESSTRAGHVPHRP